MTRTRIMTMRGEYRGERAMEGVEWKNDSMVCNSCCFLKVFAHHGKYEAMDIACRDKITR